MKRFTVQDSIDALIRDGRVSYHNTNGVQGSEKTEANKLARGQEVALFLHMSMPGGPASASQMHQRLIQRSAINPAIPLGSIRRAMSNLYGWNYVTKLNKMVPGKYGKREHLYEINFHSTKFIRDGTLHNPN